MTEKTPKQMAEAVLRPLDNKVNMKSKDSIFCDLFKETEYLLQLYEALHPEDDITQVTDITLVTLEHKMLMSQYNDLGFIVGNRLMVLVEEQSTWTVNILLRMLMYLGETYQRYTKNNNLFIYGSKKIDVPRPELYVIYPKERGNLPDEISLSKDVFGIEDPQNIFLDAKVKIIYNSKQGDILNQYIVFCHVFDEQTKLHGRTEKAVTETIRICRDKNILKEYLAREEVSSIMFGYYNEEEQMALARQQEREAGIIEGRAEGKAEGKAEGENLMGKLMKALVRSGRTDDIDRAAEDPDYRDLLYKEFQIA